MRRTYFLFLILLGFLFSCAEDPDLQFENRQLSGEVCKDCPDISIDIPAAVGEGRSAKNINAVLQEEIIAVLNYDDDREVASIEQAMQSFKEQNQALNKQYKDEKGRWEADIKGAVIYQSTELLSIRLECYTDTGGAHGFTYSTWFNFDAQKGELLLNEELFTDLSLFFEIAEEAFREKEGLKKNESLSKAGLFFDGDEFKLPENIGVLHDGILLYYNQGEVSSYIDGPIEIKLPFKKLKDILNPEYFLPLPG